MIIGGDIVEYPKTINVAAICIDARSGETGLACTTDKRRREYTDLSQVWHNVTNEPDRTRDILIDSHTVGYYVPAKITFSSQKWSHCISNYAIKRWAYVEDLIPKYAK